MSLIGGDGTGARTRYDVHAAEVRQASRAASKASRVTVRRLSCPRPAGAALHSQPFPERIIIEGRSPCKSSSPLSNVFLDLRSPPAVVVLPPRAQISIK
jgi:hypothetical protein